MPARPVPRTLVVGAGAIGCFIAARLTLAGWPCRIHARGTTLDALRAAPVLLVDPDGDRRVRLDPVSDPGERGPSDLVIVAVKREATGAVADALDGALAPGGVVLSLQNGIDNAAILAPVAGAERTAGVAVYIGVRRETPTRIVRLSGRRADGGARRDRLVGGPPGLVGDALTAVATAAGLDADVVDDPRRALWHKLVANTALNTVTALGRSRIGAILDDEAATELMRSLGREAVAVARAAGVTLTLDTADEYLADIRARLAPGFGSSTLFDLEDGRPLEHEALVGAVVREADRHDVAVPHARSCDAMLRLIDPARGR